MLLAAVLGCDEDGWLNPTIWEDLTLCSAKWKKLEFIVEKTQSMCQCSSEAKYWAVFLFIFLDEKAPRSSDFYLISVFQYLPSDFVRQPTFSINVLFFHDPLAWSKQHKTHNSSISKQEYDHVCGSIFTFTILFLTTNVWTKFHGNLSDSYWDIWWKCSVFFFFVTF